MDCCLNNVKCPKFVENLAQKGVLGFGVGVILIGKNYMMVKSDPKDDGRKEWYYYGVV